MKIITLTLNPAFDVHCRTPHFEPFHENLATVTEREAGGKGVNISRALTVNSIENLAFVVLGEENGSDFRRALDADSMKYLEITVPGRIRENITLHADDADETRISFTGFDADDSLITRTEAELLPYVDKDCIITFTGRVPSGISMQSVKAMLRTFMSCGAKVVIDSRSFSKDDLIEMKPWLIKPNQEEISYYLSREINSFEDTLSAAKELNSMGIENVMISLGSKGALLVCSKGAFTAVPPKIEALSTIGAGDSSIAGFLAAAKCGKSCEEMLRSAVAYGTAACMSSGTRPPLPCDVESVYESIQTSKL